MSWLRERCGSATLCAAFFAVSLAVRSDAPAPTAPPVNPREIAFEHDGRNVTGFVAYVRKDENRAVPVALLPFKRDSKGTTYVSLAELPDGVYSIEIAAFNRFGISPRVPTVPPTFIINRGRIGRLPVALRVR